MKIPSNLVESIRDDGKCILFAGAGIHAPPPDDLPNKYPDVERPPLGGDLAKALAEKVDYADEMGIEDPESEALKDLMRISLYIETRNEYRRSYLVDTLNDLLRGDGETEKKPSDAVRMLADCPFSIIVTTNYDQLLEQALRDAGKKPRVMIYDPRGGAASKKDTFEDPTPDKPLLFKMHGDLDESESIVITDEDYITFIQRMSDKDSPVPETVRYRMNSWPTLFVGYSLQDFNLRLLFRTLRAKLDSSNVPTSFSIDIAPDELIKKVWQDRGFVAFLVTDLWRFAIQLHTEVT